MVKNKKLSRICWSVGVFAVAFYLLSISWRLFLVLPAQKVFHVQLLEVVLPGFVWISFGSFLWGAFLSFLYGFVGAKIFCFIYSFFDKLFSKFESKK